MSPLIHVFPQRTESKTAILRVLHITTGLGNGGAEAVLHGLVTGDRSGTHHEVVSLTDSGFYGERLERAGIRVHALHLPRGRVTLSALLRLRQIIRAARADRVQTWMYHANLVGGVLAKLAGVRVIWSVHHSDLDPEKVSLLTRLIASLGARLSALVPERIVYCSATSARVHETLGYRASRSVVINNGVDVQRFAPDEIARARLRAEWGFDEHQLLIGMVARWDPLKDHASLLAGFVVARSRLPPNCRLLLVGPGMDAANTELASLVERHGLCGHVVLAGLRADVPAVMNALDLHVLSSSGEAFGNVTVEAMACGVPAVVTSVGAGAEIVGDTGWIVPPKAPQDLGGAMVSAVALMSSVSDWQRRRQACRARVLGYFSLNQMVDSYHAVWLGKPAGALRAEPD
jgi:glycosyltransferase involved in cell wall biosynthesis